MKSTQAITAVTAGMIKTSVPEFGVGDTVRVSVRVVEGSRERIQVFEGVVMRRRAGGINENFTVRRIASHSIGVERTFLLHSPRVDKIEVIRRGVVRRAQLYYLRGLTGKAARIKERRYRPADKAAAAAVAQLAAAQAQAVEEDTAAEDLETTEVDETELTDATDTTDEVEETGVAEEADATEETADAGDETGTTEETRA